ncbi:excinuclease ABC subunit C [Mycoplasmoides pneumoniae]|nr:excinuclease ABC subunit UvrC [Mycoplasmoides pneumoniae]QHR05091.1 excinuclease ABC subunit C [Mycoplasmoides pneumoniae]QHR09301.1 excinuclease ABC subunit C [Mycoplasmoides pneumoniae]
MIIVNNTLAFKLKNAPHKPGCYLWKDDAGQVLYVGKAKDIFKRVHHYFNPNRSFKTRALVERIADVEYVILKNENDALNLEAKLIKQYKPRFNLVLKENNGYLYFFITASVKPTLELGRRYEFSKNKYFGPFASSKFRLRDIYDLLLKLFPLRKCAPHERGHPCFYYQLKMCMGQCMGEDTPERYQTTVKGIEQFFNHGPEQVLNHLQQQEIKASEQQNFEAARHFLDLQKAVLELVNMQQTAFIKAKQSHDFIGYVFEKNVLAITVFAYVDNQLIGKNQQVFELPQDDEKEVESALVTFIYHYYSTNKIPKTLTVSLSEENLSLLANSLKINVTQPKNGEQKSILQTVIDNARYALNTKWTGFINNLNRAEVHQQLAQLLQVPSIQSLEIIDISFYDKDHVVGAMLRYENGKRMKALSRRYNINIDHKGDTKYMADVVYRRIISSIQTHKQLPLSDLLIVDGGIAQINTVTKVFASFPNVTQPIIIGLAKNTRHQTDHIVLTDNTTINIDKNTPLFAYLTTIQEEVDSFAKHNAFKRVSRARFQNPLLQIEGVGRKTVQILLDNFQTMQNIEAASLSELSQFIPANLAQKIKTFLKEND